MEHSHRLVLLTAATAVLLSACLSRALALPAGAAAGLSSREEMRVVPGRDLSRLATLIDRLKHLTNSGDDSEEDSGAWAVLSKDDEARSSSGSSSRGPADVPALSSSSSSSSNKLAARRQGFLGFNKREGTWSYDYGLGGGRFGKRYYGDYGIGGGRFGRDVDHVDIADTSDVSL